ncbi:hypothetical protein KUL25_10465 [Rhodobacteraceae bacterium N5(2021)]|uniref:Uncharacterized protein n=1 Tax=Gymnodinialimonas phycosphaerae TaxID=2841589 RepID=A0A975TYG3_9RHOB|nr:hypothetical protein [Gymnodinialimonas phycosphaerae]
MQRHPRPEWRNWRGWGRRLSRVLVEVRHRVPPGFRLILGLIFIAGGLLSVLPFLGLWMLPFGIAVAALDVVPLWRWFRGRKGSRRPPT